mmetsp:Transcript_7284/g.13618  ORF Transcript_7284/g.13618 Transcript_7284/m.13618 type:complete len:310 (+) Transcript_7284:1-930(+)
MTKKRSQPHQHTKEHIRVMEETVQAIGGTLNATYKAMAANMERSMQMAASMNSMMEQYLCRSIDIETFVKGTEHSSDISLQLTLSNNSNLPVPKCTLKLFVNTPEENKTVPFDVEVESRPIVEEQEQEHKVEMKKQEKRDYQIIQKNFTLAPAGKLKWNLTLEIKQVRQFNGTIQLAFPSIGTGKPMDIKHVFGIYLIHRCRREWVKTHNEKVAMSVACNYDGGFLRSFFRVPHDEGIVQGSAFSLSVAGHRILLIVNKVVGSDVELLVHMLGARFPKEEVVEEILLELDMYSRNYTTRDNLLIPSPMV